LYLSLSNLYARHGESHRAAITFSDRTIHGGGFTAAASRRCNTGVMHKAAGEHTRLGSFRQASQAGIAAARVKEIAPQISLV
jgi:hypothetical protein